MKFLCLPILAFALFFAGCDTNQAPRPHVTADSGTDGGLDGDVADDDAGDDAGDGAPDLSGDFANDACNYIDLDWYIVSCKDVDFYAQRWKAIDGPTEECDDYFTLGGKSFRSIGDAFTTYECNQECIRSASTSVSLLRCGVRTGYIVYKDAEEDCPDVFETPDGLFPSVDAWNEAFPCEP